PTRRASDLLHVHTSSSTIELDGELKVRDKTRLSSTYIGYILETIGDKNSFIVPELVDVIIKLVKTVPRSALMASLTYMSNNASPNADKRVQRVCEVTLLHAFDYLTKNPGTMQSSTDVGGLLKKMRALYQAARSSNEQVLEMRKLTEEIVRVATKSRNSTLV